MQVNSKPNEDDEIDLKEVVNILWSHKVFIIFTCALGICLAGYHAFNAKKVFTSSASYSLSGSSQDSQLSSQLDLFSNFAGLTSNDSNDLHFDEVMGREFIISLDQFLNFRDDTFFYDPDTNINIINKDPIWKATIKKLIGWKKQDINPNLEEKMWQSISSTYKDNVNLELTSSAKAIQVSVTHEDPKRSAIIANTIVQTIINNTTRRSRKDQENRLQYLSLTLAKAKRDLEDALTKKKNFTLGNSPTPVQNFILKTQNLDNLRFQLNRTSNIHDALERVLYLLNIETVTYGDYLQLRKQFPIVDQIEFRRVLGQNEILSEWSWPNILTASAVFDTLSKRRERLEAEVSAAQVDAANAGKDVEEYSSLERETEISEATYTVLIEQVKAQSMIAGYQPNNSIIYEYAVTPLTASSPNRKIILAIGAILGLVSGVMLALIFGAFRGVYYSYKTLINGAGAQQNIKSHSLIRTRRMSLNELGEKPPKKSYTHLRKLALLIHSGDKNIILFTSLNSRLKGNNVANALASYMQLDDLKIALINLSSKSLQINNKVKTTSGGEFTIINSEFKLVELQPNNELSPIEAIGRQNFHAHIQSIISNFDFIFISADDSDAIDLANAYASRDVIHFTSAKIKRTKSNNLTKLRKIIPIQGLLYE